MDLLNSYFLNQIMHSHFLIPFKFHYFHYHSYFLHYLFILVFLFNLIILFLMSNLNLGFLHKLIYRNPNLLKCFQPLLIIIKLILFLIHLLAHH
jgi:hypothetical protein